MQRREKRIAVGGSKLPSHLNAGFYVTGTGIAHTVMFYMILNTCDELFASLAKNVLHLFDVVTCFLGFAQERSKG